MRIQENEAHTFICTEDELVGFGILELCVTRMSHDVVAFVMVKFVGGSLTGVRCEMASSAAWKDVVAGRTRVG